MIKIVKCIKTYYGAKGVTTSELTQGRNYEVVDQDEFTYRIITDKGNKVCYDKEFFTDIDTNNPKFKVGDKVCVVGNEEQCEIIQGYEKGLYNLKGNYIWFEEELKPFEAEEPKEVDKELTFIEVITSIKDGEAYQSRWKVIEKVKGNILIKSIKNDNFGSFVIFDEDTTYKLKVQEIDFQLALRKYYEGRVIKSLESNIQYKVENRKHYNKPNDVKVFREDIDLMLTGREMFGKWIEIK